MDLMPDEPIPWGWVAKLATTDASPGQHKHYVGIPHSPHNTTLVDVRGAPRHDAPTTSTITFDSHDRTQLQTQTTTLTTTTTTPPTSMLTPTLCSTWPRTKRHGWRWKRDLSRRLEDTGVEHRVAGQSQKAKVKSLLYDMGCHFARWSM